MESFGLLESLVLTQVSMLALLQVIDVKHAARSDSGEDSARIRRPLDVTHSASKVERHDWFLDSAVPHLDGPVCRTREEHAIVVFIPLDSVDSQIVSFVGLDVLSTVGLRAEMNLAFFRSHEVLILIKFREIEAHTSSQAVQECFLVDFELFVLVHHELQLQCFLRLELVLHQTPVHDAPV